MAITDNIIYIAGIKDINNNRRKTNSEIGLVIPVNNR